MSLRTRSSHEKGETKRPTVLWLQAKQMEKFVETEFNIDDWNISIENPEVLTRREGKDFKQTANTFLSKVRDIVGNPEKWTQGALARDSEGQKVLTDGIACRYCLLGAMYVVQRDLNLENFFTRFLIEKMTRSKRNSHSILMDINDSFKNHDGFLAWFDKNVERVVS